MATALVPSYRKLFHDQGYYTVEKGRSILAPAAYFVELQNLVKFYINGGSQALQTRRPDLWRVVLDQENTDTLVAKLGIANTVLQNYLQSCPAAEGANLAASYPFNLPHNQHSAEIRQYLGHHQTSLPALWQLLGIAEQTATQLETLALSAAQWRLCVTPTTAPTSASIIASYGLPVGVDPLASLAAVATFLQATGLDQNRLHELLYQNLSVDELAPGTALNALFFINVGDGSAIASVGEYLVGLTMARLDNIQRFVRLAQAIGWSFTDLDWALRTIGGLVNSANQNAAVINDAVLPYLAWMQAQINRYAFTVEQCCALIGTLKNYGKKNGADFFSRVFNNPHIANCPVWSNKPTWTVASVAADDMAIQVALAAALKISQDDLRAIADSIIAAPAGAIVLTADNLAILYRLSLLPKLTGLSIKQSLLAVKLIPPLAAAQTSTPLSALCANGGPDVIAALNALSDFSRWLAETPLSLYQLQFILTGVSDDPAIQNKIFNVESAQRFLGNLSSSLEKLLVTENSFYQSIKALIDAPTSEAIALSNAIYAQLGLSAASAAAYIDASGVIVFCASTAENVDLAAAVSTAINAAPGGATYSADKIAALADGIEQVLTRQYNLQQTAFIACLAGLYNVPQGIAAALKCWGNLNIELMIGTQLSGASLLAGIIANATPQTALTGAADVAAALPLLQKLQQAAELITALSLSAAEANYFKVDYQPTSTYPITLDAIRAICQFKTLVKKFQDSQNNLLGLLKNSSTDIAASLTQLASIAGWNGDQLTYVQSQLALVAPITIANVALLQNYFSTTERLAIGMATLYELLQLPSLSASTTPTRADAERHGAEALYAGLCAQYRDQPEVLTAMRARLNETLRDRLLPLVIYSLSSKNLLANGTARGLYEYFLIDVEVSGTLQTSQIVEAISATQLYIYRCLNNLEQGVAVDKNLAIYWRWMYSYREWQANTEVFLYPEDYILPELRKNKTALFAAAESALQQADLSNPDHVERIFRDYMDGFAIIGDLTIVGSAVREFRVDGIADHKQYKELFLVGMTQQQPHHYYYRVATFSRAFIDAQDDSRYQPSDWGQWQKFNIQIQPVAYGEEHGTAKQHKIGAVSPTFCFGKWYVFWVEQQQSGSSSNANASSGGAQQNPVYTIAVYYSYRDVNQRWVAAQKLAATTSDDAIDNAAAARVTFQPISWAALAAFDWRGDKPCKDFVALALSGSNNVLWVATKSNGVFGIEPRDGIWRQTPCDDGGQVNALYNHNDILYAAGQKGVTSYAISASGGDQWLAGRTIGLDLGDGAVNCLCRYNNIIYAGSSQGLYARLPGGDRDWQWQPFESPPPDHSSIECLAVVNGIFYAGTCAGLYAFMDTAQATGWEQQASGTLSGVVSCLCSHSDRIYASVKSALFFQNEKGWQSVALDSDITALCSFDGVLYAGTEKGNVHALQADNSWSAGAHVSSSVYCLAVWDGVLYAGTDVGVSAFGRELAVQCNGDFTLSGNQGALALAESVSYPEDGDNGSFTYFRLENGQSYKLSSREVGRLSAMLHATNGIHNLLSTATQQSLDGVDFSIDSALSTYYWELFFHLPLLIANELQMQQYYKQAKRWYETLFNPSIHADDWDLNSDGTDYDKSDRYWRFVGLRAANNPALRYELDENPLSALRVDFTNSAQRAIYADDPFDPHAIAALRPIAYQKAVFSQSLDNLLAWGDSLFRQNSRESIGEAEMFYVLAGDLLGADPQDRGPLPLPAATVYSADHIALNNLRGDTAVTTFTRVLPKDIRCVYATDDTLYASDGSNLWAAADNGGTWKCLLESSIADRIGIIRAICVADGVLYIGAENGLYTVTYNGGQWSATACAPPPGEYFNGVINLYYFEKTFYVVTADQTYYSVAGLNNFVRATVQNKKDIYIKYLYGYAGVVYGFCADGQEQFLLSRDGGQSWSQPSAPQFVNCVMGFADAVYAGTDQGLWVSVDRGNSWAVVPILQKVKIMALYSHKNTLFVMAGNCLWLLYAGGSAWWQVPMGYFDRRFCCTAMRAFADTLYAIGEDGRGVQISGDGGSSWQQLSDKALSGECVVDIGHTNNTLYLLSTSGALWTLTLPPAYFGIPANQQFLGYWDKVQRRLYNIRHSLTIDGQQDVLPLFQPPLDPLQLVEALAAGEGLAQVMGSLTATIPYYRFVVMVEKAKAVAQTVIQLGQSLLAALEKSDAEQLALLYNTQQQHILNLTQTCRQDELSAAQQNVQALQAGLTNAQDRYNHYMQLLGVGLSASEQQQLNLATAALVVQAIAEPIKIASIVGYAMPNIFGFADGGMKIGDAINQGANIAEGVGNVMNMCSSLAATVASYQRRGQDWQLQQQLAQDDIAQLQYQIVAAQYQQHAAEQEIAVLAKNCAQQQAIAAFYVNKFTSNQLYRWYIGQVAALYFQAYQLAHDIAVQAENAWQFEHIGRSNHTAAERFIGPGYWNSLRQGLLAGESLQLDLQRMEKAFTDQNERRLEIEKTLSLAQLDANALLTLKATGSCTFDIAEIDFSFDFPGHYCRLIKSVAVSLPVVLGPYQNIHATLTQLSSKVVIADDAAGQAAVNYLLSPATPLTNNSALKIDVRPNQQIALSQGVNDAGLFELNFNDERYLPFEGTGAVSSWLLEIPLDENPFDFSYLTDVILQLRYTALAGGAAYKSNVIAQRGVFNGTSALALSQLPGWSAFNNSSTSSPLSFSLSAAQFRANFKTYTITSFTLIAITAAAADTPLTLTLSMAGETINFTAPASQLMGAAMVPIAGELSGATTLSIPIILSGQSAATLSAAALPSTIKDLVLSIEYTASVQ